MTPRGRRPAGEDTRAQIVEVARAQFAEHGYDRTSLRGIARAAGVDPALVHHYFDGKADVFAETMAMPEGVTAAALLSRVLDGPGEQVGARAVRTFLALWDNPIRRRLFVGLVRSATTHEAAARAFREFLAREVFGRVAARYAVDRPELRGALAASQMYGLGVTRYVLRFPAIAEADPEELVRMVGPVIQGYLVDPR
ncbi:MAG: TetR family transcriptional regulator [Dermatophilaceae bacterium]